MILLKGEKVMLKSVLLFAVSSLIVSPAFASKTSFNNWLIEFKRDAMKVGIEHNVVHDAFRGYDPDDKKYQKILKLDKGQPEFRKTFNQYLKTAVSPSRVKRGRELYLKHRVLLNEISDKYCVQPQYIVALWGMETNYGSFTGGHKVIPALATLAYAGRSDKRRAFFRKELIEAFQIVKQGHIKAASMKGSWAGAMGQSQFMPTSFTAYAVDYDGDGRKDIWGTQADVFASVANYLKTVGWDCSQRWGREVRDNPKVDVKLRGRKVKRELADWKKAGIVQRDGRDIPVVAEMKASLLSVDKKGDDRTFLTYRNYDTIMHWNRSVYFATSVGMLADKISWAGK